VANGLTLRYIVASYWYVRLSPRVQQAEMARKVVNRKELRAEAEAAERAGLTKKKKAVKKKAAKRKSKKAAAADVRMKLYWGVFSQSLKRVALYEFNQRKDAEKKAKALNSSGKAPHFVQKVKEEVVEE
jgi:hypothetical protein